MGEKKQDLGKGLVNNEQRIWECCGQVLVIIRSHGERSCPAMLKDVSFSR